MKISTVLDHIDNSHIALPEFQRGYVWNRDQVRGLFDSLYRRHPVGGLLVWTTDAKTAAYRGDGPTVTGVVKLLLDGQQRITSLYGVIRGKAPQFFDGNAQAFTGLYFHLETETFSFYQPLRMQGDPLWINVTTLMQAGTAGLGRLVTQLTDQPGFPTYIGRLSQLLSITDIELHIEEVTGADKSLDVVVDIFNRVNSGGTKLSKGDLALARICADWPEARGQMKSKLKVWADAQYNFNLDWLLRSLNTVLTGEAKFSHLHLKSPDEIRDGLKRSIQAIDTCLNLIGGRLGLDHDQVFFGRYAIPVMARYLDQKNEQLDVKQSDKLLFWFLQSGMWGRFSGSTESVIDQDLAALEGPEGGLDKLLMQLQLWHGSLRIEPGHFNGWSLGARFYPILYLLTRMAGAKDWGTGIALKANHLGRMNKLEVHHIFPKSQLYKANYNRSEVNALANFCFQTKETNLKISDRLPEEYFPAFESHQLGSLASQWIPKDPELWKLKNYRDFLEARKVLLANQANKLMEGLLHGDTQWLQQSAPVSFPPATATASAGIASEADEQKIEKLNDWMDTQKLLHGLPDFDLSDEQTGVQQAVFDLAWPHGIQEELSIPVAVLLNESAQTLALASAAGFRCFTSVASFQNYVQKEVLSQET